MAPSGVKKYDHVMANNGGDDFVGHVVKVKEDGKTIQKASIQAPDGSIGLYGYREPGDRDKPDNKGWTFWL